MDDNEEAVVQEAAADFIESLRHYGLYEDTQHMHEGVVMISLLVGERAFSQQVQDIVQADFDAEFRKMERGFDAGEFADIQAQMRSRLEAGQNPFGDD